MLRRRETTPTAIVDFQSIYVAISGDTRNELGRYPLRDERLLPLVEYTRQAILTGARQRELSVIATNSDGNPARRASLLQSMGAGATELIIDPGEDFVTAALEDPFDAIDAECQTAIGRWYKNLS